MKHNTTQKTKEMSKLDPPPPHPPPPPPPTHQKPSMIPGGREEQAVLASGKTPAMCTFVEAIGMFIANFSNTPFFFGSNSVPSFEV